MSSEKHPNLQLHKWAPTDYVKREEWNENFGIIDDKIGILNSYVAQIGVNVRQPPYNAKANGVDDDQPILQQVADYCEANNLPMYIPNGDYILNSPLKLGDNVTVVMSDNANLIRNFNTGGTSGATIQNKTQSGAGNKNIKIIGGTIKAKDNTKTGKHFGFWLVNGLQIIGTKVRGCYADWTTIFRKCTNVILYGLDIDVLGTDLYTDGIHFVGGSNITISDCIVTSVDDALAFTIETQYDDSIYNVTVSNCVLTSKKASVIKIMLSQPAWKPSTAYSVGNQVIANGNIYKCTVAGTSGTTAPSHTSGTATDGTVTWQFVSTTTRTDYPPDGTTISNINISNIVAKGGTMNAGQAIWLDDRTGAKRIKDITLSVINADCSQGSGYGMQVTSVDGLYVNDLKLYQTEGTSILIDDSKDVFLKRPKIKSPRTASANGITIRNTDYFEIERPVIDIDAVGNTANGINIGASDSPAQYGKIEKPIIRGAGGTGIRLVNANGIEITGGKLDSCANGIIEDSGSDYNIVENVDVRGVTGVKISRVGANTRVRGNLGFVTENRGPFQLNSTATRVTVAHGLSTAPSSHGIRITFRGNRGAITKWWIENVTATTFDFVVDQAPGVIVDLSFEANAPKNI